MLNHLGILFSSSLARGLVALPALPHILVLWDGTQEWFLLRADATDIDLLGVDAVLIHADIEVTVLVNKALLVAALTPALGHLSIVLDLPIENFSFVSNDLELFFHSLNFSLFFLVVKDELFELLFFLIVLLFVSDGGTFEVIMFLLEFSLPFLVDLVEGLFFFSHFLELELKIVDFIFVATNLAFKTLNMRFLGRFIILGLQQFFSELGYDSLFSLRRLE